MARVLRIPVEQQTDSSFILCHIAPATVAAASSSLDLRLTATEGASPYQVSLSSRDVAALRPKNSPCSDAEWETILRHLLRGESSAASQDTIEGVEMAAVVEEGSSIDIIVRKRTQDITQRLGTLHLPNHEDVEIELFDWCGLALDATQAADRALSALRADRDAHARAAAALQQQLTALTAAKAQHEADVLAKCRALLNSKKAKVRDQQRLLAAAHVDPAKLADVQAARATRLHVAGASRAAKRKAGTADDEEEDEDEDADAGVEQMADEASGTESDARTHSDNDATDSGDDDEHAAEAVKQATAPEAPMRDAEDDVPPPRRELPFGRGAPRKPPSDDGDETESDDGEL